MHQSHGTITGGHLTVFMQIEGSMDEIVEKAIELLMAKGGLK